MSDTKNGLTKKRKGAGRAVAHAWRGLFLGVGSAVFFCFLDVIDSFMEDIADLLFIEET